jgi:hypothetical protein
MPEDKVLSCLACGLMGCASVVSGSGLGQDNGQADQAESPSPVLAAANTWHQETEPEGPRERGALHVPVCTCELFSPLMTRFTCA